MLIREKPSNLNNFVKINNEKTIYELSLIGIFPKFMDNLYTYFEKTKELDEFLLNKEFEQWMN